MTESQDDLDDVMYRPKTAETKQTYELLLSLLQQALGDVERKVLGGAADEVLLVMKDDRIREKERRRTTDELLGRVSEETYTTLVNLCKKITDFGSTQEPALAATDDRIDETYGVNVQFESDEEEGSDFEDEVREEEVEEAAGDEADVASSLQAGHLPEAASTRKSSRSAPDVLVPRDIDAYWLQRKLSKTCDDPVAARKMANQIIDILRDACDTRDLENQLVLLLSYEQFDLIKLLCKNRLMILYCTLLASAQTPEERKSVRSTMSADPALSRILKQLEGVESEAADAGALEERGASVKGKDSGREDAAADEAHISHCKLLDLEELAFSQGSHLMANKKCDLPEGSFRTPCKGYDEIFVPPLKPKPFEANEVSDSRGVRAPASCLPRVPQSKGCSLLMEGE